MFKDDSLLWDALGFLFAIGAAFAFIKGLCLWAMIIQGEKVL